MAEGTKIAWCDDTFNPFIGCSKVHAGCANCYAEADFDKRRHVAKWGPHGTRVLTSHANWRKPLKWNRDAALTVGEGGVFGDVDRHRVFCGSLCDVFEDWRGPIDNAKGNRYWIDRSDGEIAVMGEFTPRDVNTAQMRYLTLDDVRRRLFGLIDKTPNLDWLVLSKRPENIRRMMPYRECETCDGSGEVPDWNGDPVSGTACGSPCPECEVLNMKYRENIWLGTSVSDQETADNAIPELLKCRDLAPVLFLSVEPLLGPVDLTQWLSPKMSAAKWTPRIDWVIVGGESGPNARPCQIEWIEDIVEQCDAAGVPCFVKQVGQRPVSNGPALDQWPDYVEWSADPSKAGFRLHGLTDRKGGDPSEWPKSLRVQQFPEV